MKSLVASFSKFDNYELLNAFVNRLVRNKPRGSIYKLKLRRVEDFLSEILFKGLTESHN